MPGEQPPDIVPNDMSDQFVSPTPADSGSQSRRGQTLVEFALVLPMLLVLFLGIVDFGRVFHAGIVTESAARNGAEAAAQEYLQLRRGPTPTTAADLDRITAMAVAAVCDEAERLPSRQMSGSTCTMPIAAACIHDNPAELANYSGCTTPGGVPPECDELLGPWPTLWSTDGTPQGTTLPSIEVRLCYRFDTLFNLQELQLPLANGLNIGSIWLQKGRVFTVAAY